MKYQESTLCKLVKDHKKINLRFGIFPGVDDYKKLYELYFTNRRIKVSINSSVNIYVGYVPKQLPPNKRNIVVLFNPYVKSKIPRSTIICCREKVTYNVLKKTHHQVYLINDISHGINWQQASKIITETNALTLPQIFLAIHQKRLFELPAGDSFVNSALYDHYFKNCIHVRFKPNHIHYTYILLKRDPKRETNVYYNCSKLHSFTIFEAIDGKTNAIEKNFAHHKIKVDFRGYKKKFLLRSQYGCFFSHYNVWNNIYNKGVQHNIIMEDDVFIPPFHTQRINAIIAELGIDYEYCHLLTANGKPRGDLLKGKQHLVGGHNFGNLASYMITTTGASKLINSYKILRAQVDHQLGQLRRDNKIQAVGVVKNVFYIPGTLPSNIGNNGIRRFGKKPEPIKYNIQLS